jgi:hypothetical protein
MIEDGDHVQKVLLGIIVVERPFLWWPIKFGPQNLYDMEVELTFTDSNNLVKK